MIILPNVDPARPQTLSTSFVGEMWTPGPSVSPERYKVQSWRTSWGRNIFLQPTARTEQKTLRNKSIMTWVALWVCGDCRTVCQAFIISHCLDTRWPHVILATVKFQTSLSERFHRRGGLGPCHGSTLACTSYTVNISLRGREVNIHLPSLLYHYYQDY